MITQIKFINKTIFLFFLYERIINTCYKGTLKCDLEKEQPLVCDFENGYIFNNENKICQKKFVQNCLVYNITIDPELQCYICEKDMVYDVNSSKCIEIPQNKSVSNCKYYNSQSFECLQCENFFFKKNGVCLPTSDAPIESCLEYTDETAICSKCEQGFIVENGICVKNDVVNQCLLHSNIFCTECKPNYFKYFIKSSSFEFNNSLIMNLIFQKDSGSYLKNDDQFHSICKSNSISNCQNQKNENECKECNEGYFFKKNGICEKFPAEKIENCLIYENFSSCKKCKNNFYVGSNKTCVERTSILNCSVYNDFSNSCSLCENGYYLDAVTGKCLEVLKESMNNCKFNNPTENECLSCKFGYVLSSFSTSYCVKSIPHCKYFEMVLEGDNQVPSHNCYECDRAFYLEDNKCFPSQGIEFCKHFDFQTNKCIICDDNSYIEDGKCIDFSGRNGDDDDTDYDFEGNCSYFDDYFFECMECVNLYYLDIDAICKKIDSYENCTYSDGFLNLCEECNFGYQLNDNGNCVEENVNTKSPSIQIIDSNCIYDETDENNLSCKDCKTGSKLTYNSYWVKNKEYLQALNCLVIDSDGIKCKKCLSFYKFENGVCTLKDSSTNSCKLYKDSDHIDGNFVPCEICNHELGYESDSDQNNCQLRSDPSTYFSCRNYSFISADSKCLECKENTIPLDNDQIVCLSLDEFSKYAKSVKNDIDYGFKFIENCNVMDLDLKCFKCKENYYLSLDKLSCQFIDPSNTSNYQLKTIFDSQMNISKSKIVTSEIVSNCESYSQINDNILGCGKCKTGYVGIIYTKQNSGSNFFNLIETINNENLSSGTWNPFIKCQLNSSSVFINDSDKHVETNDCEIGISFSSFEGYICIKCTSGKIGTIVEVSKDLNNNFFPENTLGIGNCVIENSNTMTNEYKAIGYEIRFDRDSAQLANYINFTKCSDQAKKIFYMFKTNLTNPSVEWIDKKLDNGDDLKEAYCLNESIALSPNKTIENCAIYAFNSFTASSMRLDNNSIDGICIACLPGYKSLNISSGIGTCQKIDNCNNSSNNVWLSSCSSPTNDSWYAETTDNVTFTKYDEPVSNENKISNCVLVDLETKSKCLMCNEGFSANSIGSCSQINTNNSFCDIPSFGISNFKIQIDLIKQNKQIIGNYYARHFSLSDSTLNNNTNSFCKSCGEGKAMFYISNNFSNDNKICGKSIKQFDEMENKNCQNFDPNSPNLCLRCKETFALNSDKACISSNISNCIKLNQQNECIECDSNFEIDENGQCVSLNCKEFEENTQTDLLFSDKGQCKVCNDNHIMFKHYYEPLEQNITYCKVNENLEDECLNYDFEFGVCVKCKNPEKVNFTYNFDPSISISEEISQNCVLNSPDQRFFHYFHAEYKYFSAIKDGYYLNFIFLVYYDTINRAYNKIGNSDTFDIDFCIHTHNVDNCSDGGTYDDPYCSSCNDFYFYLKKNNTCHQTSLSNCLKPSLNDEACLQCEDEYFLNNQACSSRINSKDLCNEYSKQSDTCSSCFLNISFLNTETNLCSEYTISNCINFDPASDSCLECAAGFRRKLKQNNNYECESLDSINCRFYDEEKDSCSLCKKGYFSNDLICEPYTVSNCESFERKKNKCSMCQNGFYLSFDGNCEANLKDPFCIKFMSNSQGCDLCKENYFVDNSTKKCVKNPNGIKNCADYISDEECKECKEAFYLSNNTCVEVSTIIPNCKSYASDNECKTCFSNFFLIENQCKEITATGCETYLSHSKCKTCKKNFFYDKNLNECLKIQIANCLEVNPLIPENCILCDSNFIVDESKEKCIVPSNFIFNCLDYYNNDFCKKCENGYILSKDKTKCTSIKSYDNFENCDVAFETEKLYCMECRYGFYLGSNFQCYEIPMKGCLDFDWILNNCKFCSPGFYMDEYGICYENN